MEIEKNKVDVFSDLNKFNGLLKPFDYRSFTAGLRGFIDAYAPLLRPDLDAYGYESIDFYSVDDVFERHSKSDEYIFTPVPEFGRGVEMLGDCLSAQYGCPVTVSLSAFIPSERIIKPGQTVIYVMDIKVPEKPELDARAMALYCKSDFPAYILDELIPSIYDRSINEPTYLLSSKVFEKHAMPHRYSTEYVASRIIDEALARGWYRVDRHGKQLLFVARLKLA